MYAYAQTSAEVAHSFVARINDVILFPLIALLTALALLLFLWGGFQYVLGSSNADVRSKGQRHMFWGIIGMLVMLSAYSILTVAANTVPGVELDRYNQQDIFGG